MASKRLQKNLGLFAVYSTATGAMFSSGFFLLPGIAVAEAGGVAAVFAYLLASIILIPAILSIAELATAMPRAGGAYFFLDRSLGPLVGVIGGLGNWIVLILKSAFALVGIGAYLELFFDFPMKPLAVVAAAALTLLNIRGARHSTWLQNGLVTGLLIIMTYFVITGLLHTWQAGRLSEPFAGDLLANGVVGLLSTVGMIFISYAGLTKVASLAEEIQRPERNIPLGILLALLSVTLIYVAGVFIMVALIPADSLAQDLTPVASAAREFEGLMPTQLLVGLIVIAAIAAFSSTGNAGILSASRYPLAMARDQLVWQWLGQVGRYKTPTAAIVVTGLMVMTAILLLDVQSLAKLASVFQLLLFALLNVALLVMRSSHTAAYLPGFQAPLYPWLQLSALLVYLGLIVFMGLDSVLFSLSLIAIGVVWYWFYSRRFIDRYGAVGWTIPPLHAPEHLNQELLTILEEESSPPAELMRQVVNSAELIVCETAEDYSSMLQGLNGRLDDKTLERMQQQFPARLPPPSGTMAVARLEAPGDTDYRLLLLRLRKPIPLDRGQVDMLMILLAPAGQRGASRRILAEVIRRLRRAETWDQLANAKIEDLRQLLR